MSPEGTRIVYLADVLAVAARIVSAPSVEAVQVSADARVALAVAVLAQHDMIRAAGLVYPQASHDGAPA